MEVKATLEFNSLAAALVEGLLFSRCHPERGAKPRFVVVALVSKITPEIASRLADVVFPEARVEILIPNRPEVDPEFGTGV